MKQKNTLKKLIYTLLFVSGLCVGTYNAFALTDLSTSSLSAIECPPSSQCSLSYDIPEADDVLHKRGHAQRENLQYGNPLQVLVWNVYKGQKDGLLNDLAQLSQKMDLMILQESMLNDDFGNTFDQVEGMAWHTALSFYEDNVGTGVATGTRIAASQVDFIRSEAREPFIKTPKMIITANLPIEGNKNSLLVANIHGINFVSTASFKSHMDQLFERLSTHQGPIVLGGDFNTWNNGRKKYLLKKAEQERLIWLELASDKRKLVLDHLFVRNINVHQARLLTDYNTSDHLPLYLEMSLEKDRSPTFAYFPELDPLQSLLSIIPKRFN